MLKISHPSTQQLVRDVERQSAGHLRPSPPLGSALLRNLIEVAHAFMSMGFAAGRESSVMEEMRRDAPG